MSLHAPRVLDASALSALFAGHPMLMRMIDDAEAGNVFFLVLPTTAMWQAETFMHAGHGMWDHFLRFRSIRPMELSDHVAIESARLSPT